MYLHCSLASSLLSCLPCRFGGDIKSSEGATLVDEYHSKYIAALTELWETHKAKYGQQGMQELRLVE